MKKILQKIILPLIIVLTLSINALTPAFAASFQGRTTDCPHFLGLTSWDCGVSINNENELKTGVWLIVLNIASDITVIASYLVIGFIIYGGYQYMLSGGDTGKVANGKKTLVNAFIGLAIVLSAGVIMNAIRIALIGGNFDDCVSDYCVDPNTLVTSFINWIIGIAGLVSAIFLVYGGITYITASGDAGKLQRAKSSIIYSLIGLAIVALATIISAFVSSNIRKANEDAFINNTYISKEVHENKIN